jgi:YbbR domain-containing protein
MSLLIDIEMMLSGFFKKYNKLIFIFVISLLFPIMVFTPTSCSNNKQHSHPITDINPGENLNIKIPYLKNLINMFI